MNMKILQSLVLGTLATIVVAGAEDPALRRKYIGHGWDLLAVSPEEVLAHADAFDASGLDGVSLMLRGTLPDGKHISHSTIMNDAPWPREALKAKIPVFREIVKHPGLKESFLSSWWAPHTRLAWTNDAAWANFAANMGTVAWLAKEGGLRGILVDGEDYPNSRQYTRLAGDPSYDEAAKLARARGAQVFGAIFKEYPDITFLSFWMLSITPSYFYCQDPLDAARSRSDLWPAFLNGMLDVMPPTARFVDGNEHAYRYEAEKGEFFESASLQRSRALGLIAPENRAKYRAGLLAGFGLYLDSYVNPTNSHWYFGPVNGTRLAHFEQNLAQATRAADEYIWIYGEKKSWVPWKNTQRAHRYETNGTWEVSLPGFSDVLLRTKAPSVYLDRRFAALTADPSATNLAAGVKYGTWQDEKRAQGRFYKEGGARVIESSGNGCYTVPIANVTPGETFAVEVTARGDAATASCYWQKNGVWQWFLGGTHLTLSPTPDGRRRGRGFLQVPKGADKFLVLLGANLDPSEKVFFDDLRVYRLSK